MSELLRHALVQDAALKNKQRLGTNAADPAEISLELRSHRNDGVALCVRVCVCVCVRVCVCTRAFVSVASSPEYHFSS